MLNAICWETECLGLGCNLRLVITVLMIIAEIDE
jgi:hypothetical protein